jgi:hypothetical protein
MDSSYAKVIPGYCLYIMKIPLQHLDGIFVEWVRGLCIHKGCRHSLICPELGGKFIEAFLWPRDKENGLPAHGAFREICRGWIPLIKLLKQAGKAEDVFTHDQP